MGSIKTIARFGSVAAGSLVPWVYDQNKSLGNAFAVGFFVSLFSLASAVGASILDRSANDDYRIERSKVNLRDILSFGKLFWLANFACMITYIPLLNYNQIVS